MRKVPVGNIVEAGEELAKPIIDALDAGKKVLWFISGGSSVPIAIEAAQNISTISNDNLHFLLVDEKFTSVDQEEANWSSLTDGGFAFADRISPILRDSIQDSLEEFKSSLETEIKWADFTIGQFGLGEGFHTGGIQAGSPAVTSEVLAINYEQSGFQHITVTTGLIKKLDIAFINSMGESKRELVDHFIQSDATVNDEPTQILKETHQTILVSDVFPKDK